MKRYKNAQEAFEQTYKRVNKKGQPFNNTRALFEEGFIIEDPLDNEINTKWRKWSIDYAKAEWEWYLSGDPSIYKLGEIYGKIPEIWKRMADENGNVNSNYGYQWKRENQLEKIVEKLKENNTTRQATISIYDAKEISKYNNDTPCTYSIQFTVVNDKLNMSVYMRSNDVWFGFCNDQYCFSMLQKLVSEMCNIKIGEYYHHAHNMHLYGGFFDRDSL